MDRAKFEREHKGSGAPLDFADYQAMLAAARANTTPAEEEP